MRQPSSTAERLDRAIDGLLDGLSPARAAATAGVEPPTRDLVLLADGLRRSLTPPPIAPRFEARLGARLVTAIQARDPVAWARRHQGRLIVTGAVSSAVGVGVTAYAVWRSTRRGAGPAHRLLHR
jgi:hypothetical protein